MLHTARDTDCCTIKQETLTAAQYIKTHWLLQKTDRDTDCRTIQQETLTAALYSKKRRVLRNTARVTNCCTVQQDTLTAAQSNKRGHLLHNTTRNIEYRIVQYETLNATQLNKRYKLHFLAVMHVKCYKYSTNDRSIQALASIGWSYTMLSKTGNSCVESIHSLLKAVSWFSELMIQTDEGARQPDVSTVRQSIRRAIGLLIRRTTDMYMMIKTYPAVSYTHLTLPTMPDV